MKKTFTKVSKNYYRDILIDLIGKTNGKPILFSGKYKHRQNEALVTFTCIRPTIQNGKPKTICDHVNFALEDVAQFYPFSEVVHNRKFYIIGYPSSYSFLGELRGCIKLEHDLSIPPVFIVDELKKHLNDNTKDMFYYPTEMQLSEL